MVQLEVESNCVFANNSFGRLNNLARFFWYNPPDNSTAFIPLLKNSDAEKILFGH